VVRSNEISVRAAQDADRRPLAAHNKAAIGLYRKFGFVEEGRLVRHIRRADGQLWDLIEMGLLL
jgi:ribosomal protein S18 acetylase RimI-like enzyme